MTAEQRQNLEAMLRTGPLNLEADLASQRETFEQMMASLALPEDVQTSAVELGGISAIDVRIRGAADAATIFYLHGGAYVMGSAQSSRGLASDIARRVGARALTIDYRLAPEHPFPAALDDITVAYRALIEDVDPSSVVFVGESAGGGLVLAALIALRDDSVPLPAAAAVFSPFADLTLSGASIEGKAAADPVLTEAGLRLRGGQYVGITDAASPHISTVFADFSGLPPLLVQVGSREVLLDDAVRIAERAAAADVGVRLEVTAGVPHVFQGFAGMLQEGDAALARAGDFLRAQLEGDF